nr:Replicase polyprotein 1ab [Plantactinospora alkalitolerans]
MARHLVATGQTIDEDPALALEHALAARRLAARIAAVREAVGLAAYRAGEWQTAIAELRTYHRMSGRQTHLAVLGDCERALGRPERAIDLYRGADREAMDPAGAIELLIVAAGARGDMGQRDAAVAMLQVRELTAATTEPWAPRLRYAYADALLAVSRLDEAREWFSRAADADEFGETDAAERLLELDGVVLEGDDDDSDDDDNADNVDDNDESDDGDGPDAEHDDVDLEAEDDGDEDGAQEIDDVNGIDDDDDDDELADEDDLEGEESELSGAEVGAGEVAALPSEPSTDSAQAEEPVSDVVPAEAEAEVEVEAASAAVVEPTRADGTDTEPDTEPDGEGTGSAGPDGPARPTDS